MRRLREEGYEVAKETLSNPAVSSGDPTTCTSPGPMSKVCEYES
jgi:hypothetical protein